MSESRQELLNWVNGLLLLDLTKVEQCGTGAVLCQIYDSIFLDVPMGKVKFDVNTEYQYLNNFKVLQSTFVRHGIDRSIPVERLVKCRFQDNLEFLQFTRRFWDNNFPGHDYDPLARRKGGPVPQPLRAPQPTRAPVRPRVVSNSSLNNNTKNRASSAAANRISSVGTRPARPSSARPSSVAMGRAPGPPSTTVVNGLKEKVKQLEVENEGLIQAVEVVESERDFYFQKLRDVEVLIQTAADQLDSKEVNGGETVQDADTLAESVSKLSVEDKFAQLVRDVQTILYSTAEGFEIPTQDYETEETF